MLNSEYVKIFVLAVIQGIAEFLPISSSGHLAILSKLFNVQESAILVNIILHAGTLLAILVYYFKDLLSLLTPQKRQLLPILIVASLPVGIIGIIFKTVHLAERLFDITIISGFGLLITGSILFYCNKKNNSMDSQKALNLENISFTKAFKIGCFQALALIPGISRSGSTISAALLCNVKKEDAATFSFLLAVPAIGGACFFELLSLFGLEGNSISSVGFAPLIIGFFTSAIVGYGSLVLLIKTLKKGKLIYFSFYCFFIALVVITWQLF